MDSYGYSLISEFLNWHDSVYPPEKLYIEYSPPSLSHFSIRSDATIVRGNEYRNKTTPRKTPTRRNKQLSATNNALVSIFNILFSLLFRTQPPPLPTVTTSGASPHFVSLTLTEDVLVRAEELGEEGEEFHTTGCLLQFLLYHFRARLSNNRLFLLLLGCFSQP